MLVLLDFDALVLTAAAARLSQAGVVVGEGVRLEILFDAVWKWEAVDAVHGGPVDDGMGAQFVERRHWNENLNSNASMFPLNLKIFV